eukprot:Hpha_TRINITY_DN16839_c0_g3::TRINITY_DN16839_c0_g3_i1::g.153821::m.153821
MELFHHASTGDIFGAPLLLPTPSKLGVTSRLQSALNTLVPVVEKASQALPDDGALRIAARALADCAATARCIPLALNPIAAHQSAQESAQARLHQQDQVWRTVADVAERIRMMQPGGVTMVPAGWVRNATNDADDEGHAVIFVVHRKGPDDYTIGLCNLGEGVTAHPVMPCPAPPIAGEMLRRIPLVASGVPAARAACGVFWYLALRPLVQPHKTNGPHLLYQTLLPFLSRVPLRGAPRQDEGAWFARIPPRGDAGFGLLVLTAIRFGMRCARASRDHAAWASEVFVRAALLAQLKKAATALCPSAKRLTAPGLSTRESQALRVAAKTTARAATEFPGDETAQEEMRQLVASAEKVATQGARQPASGSEVAGVHEPPASDEFLMQGGLPRNFFLWGSMRRDTSVDELAGAPPPPRILLPVPLAELPETFEDAKGLVVVLAKSLEALTLLSNQQDQMPQSIPLRFAYITHLAIRVLPLPLHAEHPERDAKCFWRRPIAYDTQQQLLRQVFTMLRHFTAVACAMRADRETDGARVIVSAALTAVVDVLCRSPVEGKLSLFAEHYSGRCRGPVSQFGFDCDELVGQTDTLLLCTPELTGVRTSVLDYWLQQRGQVRSDRVLFEYGGCVSLGEGDHAFVRQLAASVGIPGHASKEDATLLFTGERPALVEACPEFAVLRDAAFLQRMILSPTIEALPQPGIGYDSCSARLTWAYRKAKSEKDPEGGLTVRGFGKCLDGTCARPPVQKRTLFRGFLERVGIGKRMTPRNPSHADPSLLVGAEVETEEDVLFLQEKLPTFGGALRPGESELLLTMLTAPFLRIPLLLGFLCDRERMPVLADPAVQRVLDAALFEPSSFQTTLERQRPAYIPAESRDHLATPAGLLFMELHTSPQAVLRAVETMLEYALERDTGRFNSPSVSMILYITRLASRVDAYVQYVVEHAKAHSGKEGVDGLPPAVRAGVRGLMTNTGSEYNRLAELSVRVGELLRGPICRALSRWCRKAIQARNLSVVCKVYAHLALLYRGVREYDFGAVATLLAAQVFLTNFFPWGERPAIEELGMTEMEVFDVFERHRRPMWEWMKSTGACSNVAEAVARVATLTGDVFRDNPGAPPHPPRNWVTPASLPGCLVPDTHTLGEDWLTPRQGEDYLRWLLRTTQGPDSVMVNVNLGEFSLRKHELKLVPPNFTDMPDFKTVFNKEQDMHCADVAVTTRRHWLRLLGRRHDLMLWDPDDREPSLKSESLFAGSRSYNPSRLGGGEKWVAEILEPVMDAHPVLRSLQNLTLPSASVSEEQYAVITGVLTQTVPAPKGREGAKFSQVKEIVVYRDPQAVHVYDVIEHGRRFYRRQRFTSDAVWSLHAPHAGVDGSVVEQRVWRNGATTEYGLSAGCPSHIEPPASSLVIQRTESKEQGTQSYVPSRYLSGLLPDVLLSDFEFWQLPDDSLSGTLLVPEDHAMPCRLHVELTKLQKHDATAVVTRIAQRKVAGGGETKLEDDPTQPNLQLVNLLHPGAKHLARTLCRAENLSHTLVWASTDGRPAIVELPRMRLSFRAEGGVLACEQHAGLALYTGHTEGEARALAAQFGGGTLWLQSGTYELYVLVSAISEPLRPDTHAHSVTAVGARVVAIKPVLFDDHSTAVAAGTEGVVQGRGRRQFTVSVLFDTGEAFDAHPNNLAPSKKQRAREAAGLLSAVETRRRRHKWDFQDHGEYGSPEGSPRADDLAGLIPQEATSYEAAQAAVEELEDPAGGALTARLRADLVDLMLKGLPVAVTHHDAATLEAHRDAFASLVAELPPSVVRQRLQVEHDRLDHSPKHGHKRHRKLSFKRVLGHSHKKDHHHPPPT